MIVTGVATTGMAIMAGPASAHHPDLTVATGACRDGHPVINVTATAWVTDVGDDHRVNNSIGISVDGVQVATGAFKAPDYSFVSVITTTPGTHTVRATSLVNWGANENLGSIGAFTETTLTVDACPVETSTTATTTTTAASTTTAAPPVVAVKGTVVSTTAAPPTAAPPTITVKSEQLTQTTVAAQQLPRTGSNSRPLFLLALLFVFGGATLLGIERRMRVARRS